MSRTMTTAVVLLGLTALLPAAAKKGSALIDADQMRAQVEFLASDDLLGRDTGSPGIRKAEDYIARQFKRLDLAPLPGRDDYFVDFTLYRQGYDDATAIALRVGGREITGKSGVDFRPFPFSEEGTVEADVVFAGYGITATEYDYDDYGGLDVEGKLVLVLRHEPGEKDPDSRFDGTSSSNHALFTTKAANAKEHGAAGMLLVTDPLNHEAGDDLRAGGSLHLDPPDSGSDDDGSVGEAPFLAVQINQAMAARMVEPSGRTLAEVQQAIDDGTGPKGFVLDGVSARVTVQRSDEPEPVAARNVAAFVEGRDPVLKNEWIVVGGHHDHVGGYQGSGDTVFNGADDNASGTSGVMGLAAAFATRAEAPRRSIAFMTFSGEEKGLLGSRAVVEHELIPVEQVVFMLNLDMIGRNPKKSIDVVGDGYAKGLREIVEAANVDVGLPLSFGGAGYAGNSDHDAFYKADIPFMFFFTGIHEDYHQIGDHSDKLSYDRMERIVRTAYSVLDRIAEADTAPAFIHHVNWLGVRVEVLEQDGASRAVITNVDEESRATKAGLQTGDVLVAFGESELEEAARVGAEFRAIEPGTSTALAVQRGDERLELAVERAKVGYMGVFPAPVDEDQRKSHGLADDEGIILRSVVKDGPSSKAGLREGDIIFRISGQPVGLTSLRRHLSQIGAGETVDMMVIRDGERITIPVTLGERPQR